MCNLAFMLVKLGTFFANLCRRQLLVEFLSRPGLSKNTEGFELWLLDGHYVEYMIHFQSYSWAEVTSWMPKVDS